MLVGERLTGEGVAHDHSGDICITPETGPNYQRLTKSTV